MRSLIIALLLLMVACAPMADAPQDTPQDDCSYLTDFPVVSINPCLKPPYIHDATLSTIQVVPEGWGGWQNTLVNADGNRTKYAGRAEVYSFDVGLKLIPHNNEHGINGKWALYQDVELSPGCYAAKMVLDGRINDPIIGQAQDYGASLWLDDTLLTEVTYGRTGLTEVFKPFEIGADGTYRLSFSIDQYWPSAGHNSELNIRAAGVMAMDIGYCGRG
jgi:hypothetical protein